MAKTKWTEDYFRKGLKAERERRGLTQEKMAELFKAEGLNLHWSTIAKIETGDRSVRIDEAACIADIFKVSLDTMVGRMTTGDRDELYTERALVHEAGHTTAIAESLESSLRDRIADVTAFNPEGWARDLVTGCEAACEALAAAQDTLRNTLSLSGNRELRDLVRKQLREELDRGEDGR
jgi:transcriptional regulator with XRE-family HTH domain